jgi:hypothetical protein
VVLNVLINFIHRDEDPKKLIDQCTEELLKTSLDFEEEKSHLDFLQVIFECLRNGKCKAISSSLLPKVPKPAFSLPADLVDLNKEIGECPSCLSLTSSLMICFLCGFKVCVHCDEDVSDHVDEHLGSAIFIMVASGEHSYYAGKKEKRLNTLYRNYFE